MGQTTPIRHPLQTRPRPYHMGRSLLDPITQGGFGRPFCWVFQARLELGPSLFVCSGPADLCPHMAGHLLHPAPSRALLFCTKHKADDANGHAFTGLERYAALRRCLPSASVCSRATVSVRRMTCTG